MPDRVNRHADGREAGNPCVELQGPQEAPIPGPFGIERKCGEVSPWEGLLVYRGAFRLFPLFTWWTYLAEIIHHLSQPAKGRRAGREGKPHPLEARGWCLAGEALRLARSLTPALALILAARLVGGLCAANQVGETRTDQEILNK
jgi:hypothetical protein